MTLLGVIWESYDSFGSHMGVIWESYDSFGSHMGVIWESYEVGKMALRWVLRWDSDEDSFYDCLSQLLSDERLS